MSTASEQTKALEGAGDGAIDGGGLVVRGTGCVVRGGVRLGVRATEHGLAAIVSPQTLRLLLKNNTNKFYFLYKIDSGVYRIKTKVKIQNISKIYKITLSMKTMYLDYTHMSYIIFESI